MNRLRVGLLFLMILVVGSLAVAISLYARGYRLDPKTWRLSPNGLLVLQSDPEGAQVFINGDLRTATDTTLSLSPGTYDVSVRKDGFWAWNKRLVIQKEIVTQATAHLFRTVPSLSAITFTGIINPVASPDFTKIAYAVAPAPEAKVDEKSGLWVIETLDFPLGFARDPRRVTDGDLRDATWEWSPDGQDLLLTTKVGTYLLPAGTFTAQNQRVNVASKLATIRQEWKDAKALKLAAQTRSLPAPLADMLNRKAKTVLFAPDLDMVAYTASGSGVLPDKLIAQLPGASTQKEERTIKDSQTYVYDIKEDRNFLIDSGPDLILGNTTPDGAKRRLAWFPTSRHLVLFETDKITILDYDGTNRQVVYTGSFMPLAAFPTPNKNRLLILTNLGANSSAPNLYSVSLK